MKCYKAFTEIPRDCYAHRVIVRVPGLIGDAILASTRFDSILKEHDAPFMILSTYPYVPARLELVKDLYRELFENGTVAEMVNCPSGNPPLDSGSIKHFLAQGAIAYYDPVYRDFDSLPATLPKLGPQIYRHWHETVRPEKTVALFRRSAFHSHVPERNRPQDEWQEAEKILVDRGYEMALFGYDDDLANIHNLTDYRHALSIYDTIKAAAGFEQLISVTTFLPIFCQFFVPCYVLADPTDIEAVKKLWRVRDNYHILDASEDWIAQIRSAFVG